MPQNRSLFKKIAAFLGFLAFYLVNFGVFLALYTNIFLKYYGNGVTASEHFQKQVDTFFGLTIFSQVAVGLLCILPLISLFVPFAFKAFSHIGGLLFYFFAIEVPLFSYALLVLLFEQNSSSQPHTLIVTTFSLIFLTPIFTALLSLLPPNWQEKLTAPILVIQTILTSIISYFGMIYLFFLVPIIHGFFSGFIHYFDEVINVYTQNSSFFVLITGFIYFIFLLFICIILPTILLIWLYKKLRTYTLATAGQTFPMVGK